MVEQAVLHVEDDAKSAMKPNQNVSRDFNISSSLNTNGFAGVGCLRSGYICEGYPATTRYQENRAKRISISPPSQPPPETSDIIMEPNSNVESVDNMFEWFFADEALNSFQGPPDLSVPDSLLDADLIDIAQVQPEGLARPQSQTAIQIPRNLPFLINGVNTPAEQQFFIHFTNVTSRVLTISTSSANPLLTTVLPRSLQDTMIQKAILCLGASHLLSLQPQPEQKLQAEKQRLLRDAEALQVSRIAATKRGQVCRTPAEFDAVLSSTMLLCLYEISEGSGDLSWRVRLDVARDIIQDALELSQHEKMQRERPPYVSTDIPIDEFILEFFLYHDILAGVTDRTRLPILKSNAIHSSFSSGQNAFMMGVNDGLFDLVAKVAALHATATINGPCDGRVICEAVVLWDELDNLVPSTDDKDQKMAFSAYISALFVWLYSIVYPDNITDDKIRAAVKRGLDDMQSIRDSGVLAVLLFPTFILGFSSITEQERIKVTSQFDRLQKFSGLGNVKLARDLVLRSWVDYDAQIPKAWDWVQQMELQGISLPVT